MIGAGFRVGRLVTTSPTTKRLRDSVVWTCLCDCGEAVDRCAASLKAAETLGQLASCGCATREGMDLAGQRFGRLAVLARAGRGRQGDRWRCKCDCGHETVTRTKDLRNGTTTSCGCAQRRTNKVRRDIMPGDRFGRLVAQYDTGERSAGGRLFLCLCDCGREVKVRKALLNNGQTKSCGCLTGRSRGVLSYSGVIETLCDAGRIVA